MISKNVILNDDLLIAKGSGRACYIHPEDSTKVIKVTYSEEGISNDQNFIDYEYSKYLRKHKKNLSNLVLSYDFIKTNLGDGLVFDRIMNYDQSSVKSFRYLLAKKIITVEEQKKLLTELNEYLEKEDILFIDNSLTNILCQKDKENNYKLMIVDGLGAKRRGLKFWLYLNCSLYRKYKVKKQWIKLMKSYKKDLKRTTLNKNPITRF
ncbi:PhoP regulatory network protein YrbL [Arcobacter sp. 15-2]|uniref:YrbL family protein n=1 Tax=Arcobacter sp. 15-2 TaxID=3374109 RepID=UPI00399CDAA1